MKGTRTLKSRLSRALAVPLCISVVAAFSGSHAQTTSAGSKRALRAAAWTSALLFFLCIPAQAAITVTARGTGGNNTAATTITVTPSGTIAVGSMGILVIATDNAGSGGATAVCPTTFTDVKGNVWTRRINPIYDPGAAAAGVEMGFYTAPIAVALLATDNTTVTWAGSVSVTAKAWAIWEIVPTAGKVAQYVTGACGATCGSATTAPTVTTVSITSGDAVIGGGGAESANTWVADADTTNGTWSTQQAAGFGTSTTGMSVASQSKVVTATATQTYNPTLTSADTFVAYIQITEVTPAKSGFFFFF